MELALFRVLQEALTNVHRHASCSSGEVTIEVDAVEVSLRVKDNGSGIPHSRHRALRESSAEVGVGLAGMRERVRDLGATAEEQVVGRVERADSDRARNVRQQR